MTLRKPWNRGGIRTWILIAGIVATLAGYGSTQTLLLGTAVLLVSMLMQFWSKGCLHRNKVITQSGPYRFVRHPFYLGNFILDAGLVIMSGCWFLILVFPFWWLAVYIPVMRSEQETLIGFFGDKYRDYMKRVPMLFPIRRPLPPSSEGGFDWKRQSLTYSEVPRATKYLVYPFIFALAQRVYQTDMQVFTSPELIDFLLIAGIGVIMAFRVLWMYRFPRGKKGISKSEEAEESVT